MIELLTNELDTDLKHCEYFASIKNLASARTFFDHAFGKMQMFILLNLNSENEVINLWDTKYRPAFETAIYGG